MKLSRIRHVLITSIIFIGVIIFMVFLWRAEVAMWKSNTEELVYRVIATRDIQPGEVIDLDNVDRQQIQNVLKADGMIFKLNKEDSNQEYVKVTDTNREKGKADLWAIGKVASEKIYKGEVLLNKKLSLKSDVVADDTRLYSIPFDSETTGGYNIAIGEEVDICVLYNDDDRTIVEYQKLEDNKAIDIVLAQKKIADIRDESGNSGIEQPNVRIIPGYICFNLTYEEINKIEIAKRQGNLFVGKPGSYYVDGSQSATFMPDATMPNF